MYINFQQIDLKFPNDFAYILFPALKCPNEYKAKSLCPYDTSWINMEHGHHNTPTFEKFGVYQALQIKGFLRNSLDYVENWVYKVNSYEPVIRPPAVSNLFVKLLIFIQSDSLKNSSNKVYYLLFHRSNYPQYYDYNMLSHNNLQIKMDNLLDPEDSQSSWSSEDSNIPALLFYKMRCKMEHLLQDKHISFQNFEIWMKPDKFTIWEMHKNNTLSHDCSSNEGPSTKQIALLQSSDAHRMAV